MLREKSLVLRDLVLGAFHPQIGNLSQQPGVGLAR